MYCNEEVPAAMNIQGGASAAAVPRALGRRSWLMHRTAALWVAYVALGVLLAIPMLASEVPLGVDTLNHLARIHVRANIGRDADLARLFEVRSNLVPYMGLDWLMTPLARVMPTLLAGRVFIVLLLWATVGAVVVVQRVFTGRIGFEPLLMVLVSYNALLGWGLLNYLVGVVGALLGFAAWHGVRSWPWAARLLLFTAVATGLYVVHLLALALYGALLGAYEVFARRAPWRTPVRDWLVLGLQFGPAALLYMQLDQASSHAPLVGSWGLAIKPLVLASPFLFSGIAGGLTAGLLVFAMSMVLLYRLTRSGVLHWNRELGACAAVLTLAGLAIPGEALGVGLVDMRFPPVAAALAIAAIRLTGSGRQVLPVFVVLGVAAVAQIGSAAVVNHACGPQFQEMRDALAEVPRGTVLTAVLESDAPVPGASCTGMPIYEHMPQLFIIDRSGYSPDFFGLVTSVTARDGRETDFFPIQTHEMKADSLPAHGRILWMHRGNRTRPIPPDLKLVHAGSFFDLYERP